MSGALAARAELWRMPEACLPLRMTSRSASRAPSLHPVRPQRRRHCLAAAAAGSASGGASSSAQQLKQALMQAMSRSNNPRPGDSLLALEQEVESLAEQLAGVNPTPAPATSPLLNGSWALLFSGRSRRLAASATFPSSASGPTLQEALQAASDTAYSAFYRYVPVLAGSAVGPSRGGSASNVQVLRPGRVDNVVETRGAVPLRLCVSGSVEVVRPADGRPASCVAVRFDSFTAKAGPFPQAAFSLGWLRPLGYVDTLYLDEEFRVSVGDKGGLFVLRRVAGEDVAAGADARQAVQARQE